MSSNIIKGQEHIPYHSLLDENQALKDEIQSLKARLEESEELKRAISEGDLDALVLPSNNGELIFTLDSADRAYRTLVETMNEGTATLAFDGTILYCNRQFAELLKTPALTIIGMPIYRFIAYEDMLIFKSLLDHNKNSSEVKLQDMKGELLPVYMSISSLKNEHSPNAWCLVVTDLTEQKKNEEIVASERLARSIIEQASEAIIICDASGRIIRYSESSLDLFGLLPTFHQFEHIINLRLSKEGDTDERIFPVSSALEGFTIHGVEVFFENNWNHQIYMVLNSTPLKNANGDIIGCILALTDITELKQNEAALQKAYEELQAQSEEIQSQNKELQAQSEEISKAYEELKMSEEKSRLLIDYAPTGIFEIDFINMRFTSINDAICQMLDYSKEELMALNPFNLYDDEGKIKFRERVSRLLAGYEISDEVEYRMISKNGRINCVLLNMSYKYKNGKIIGALVVLHDITERKRIEEVLIESEARFRSVLDNSADIIYRVNFQTGFYDYISPSSEQVVGYSPSELMAMDAETGLKMIHPEDLPAMHAAIAHLEDTGKAEATYRQRAKNGEYRWISNCMSLTLDNNGQPLYRNGNIRDITESKQAEEKLESSNQKISEILSSIQDDFYVLDPDWNFVYANKQFTSRIGKEPEDFVGNNIWQMFPNYSGTVYEKNLRAVIDEGEVQRFEVGGKYTNTYYMMTAFPSSEGVTVLGTDITVQKKTEEALHESEKRLKLLSEANSLLLSSKDPEKAIQTIAEKVMHYLNCDVFFNYVFDDVRDKLHLNAYAGIYEEAAKGIEWLDEGSAICGCVAFDGFRIVSEDVQLNGDRRADLVRSMGIQAYACNPLRIGENTVGTLSFGTKSRKVFMKDELALMSTVADQISVAIERKRAEEALKKAHETLEEKVKERTYELEKVNKYLQEINIVRKQEIHHRIKNNLQVISSLLDLQAEKFRGKKNIEDSQVLEAFKESQDRVISMALIHEELHKGGKIDTLNFSSYIQELAENLFLSYRLGNDGISLDMDVKDDIYYDMDTSVPLGIIINELVSNSLKHAFSGKDRGKISIKLFREESEEYKTGDNKSINFVLSMTDNGIGIPDDLYIEDLDSLGLQLVSTLVEQLDGELELKRDNGTEFIIRFAVIEKDNQAHAPCPQIVDND